MNRELAKQLIATSIANNSITLTFDTLLELYNDSASKRRIINDHLKSQLSEIQTLQEIISTYDGEKNAHTVRHQIYSCLLLLLGSDSHTNQAFALHYLNKHNKIYHNHKVYNHYICYKKTTLKLSLAMSHFDAWLDSLICDTMLLQSGKIPVSPIEPLKKSLTSTYLQRLQDADPKMFAQWRDVKQVELNIDKLLKHYLQQYQAAVITLDNLPNLIETTQTSLESTLQRLSSHEIPEALPGLQALEASLAHQYTSLIDGDHQFLSIFNLKFDIIIQLESQAHQIYQNIDQHIRTAVLNLNKVFSLPALLQLKESFNLELKGLQDELASIFFTEIIATQLGLSVDDSFITTLTKLRLEPFMLKLETTHRAIFNHNQAVFLQTFQNHLAKVLSVKTWLTSTRTEISSISFNQMGAYAFFKFAPKGITTIRNSINLEDSNQEVNPLESLNYFIRLVKNQLGESNQEGDYQKPPRRNPLLHRYYLSAFSNALNLKTSVTQTITPSLI